MSLRRVSPNCWIRVKNGKLFGIGSFLTCIALAKFIIPAIGSTGINISFTYYLCAGLVSICIGLIVAYIRGHMKLLPDSLIDEMSADGLYTCQFCSAEKLREACEMTRPYYGNEYVSANIAEQWRMKDPQAFVQIINSNGELCACFGILALSNSFMDQYIKGNISDTQLREDDILPFEESKNCKRLYISGVIVRDPSKHVGHKRACVMIWVILIYLKRVFGLKQERELYAVAVTKESERLLKNFNSELISNSKCRKDKHNMYRLYLSRNTWHKMVANVGSYSSMCKISF